MPGKSARATATSTRTTRSPSRTRTEPESSTRGRLARESPSFRPVGRGQPIAVGARAERLKRAFEVTRVARRTRLLRVLREIGVVGSRPATREGAVAFREALEELGTTYIKLGQLLSSRPDLLPDEYIEELGHLVDSVPAVPFAALEPVIRQDLGTPFARIDPEPLAAASIAQIHRAVLDDGRAAVVK